MNTIDCRPYSVYSRLCNLEKNSTFAENLFLMKKKTDINIKFGKHLASLRKEKRWSQEELSFKVELNRTYIGDLERGEKCPSLETLIKIAKGFEISLQELLDYDYE